MARKKLELEDVKRKAQLDPEYAKKVFREMGERKDLEPAERKAIEVFTKDAKNKGVRTSRMWSGVEFNEKGEVVD